jgi:hypothetical protein
VNTNAGRAFLNALLARAQSVCCAELVHRAEDGLTMGFDTRVLAMFREQREREDAPEAQYLYPEFLLAQQMLIGSEIDAVICDTLGLECRHAGLFLGALQIDLVYNRLVDRVLAEPGHSAVRRVYQAGAVVLTPNPHNLALLAHNRNLTLLSDPVALAGLGVPAAMIGQLAGILQTRMVTPNNADELWAAPATVVLQAGVGAWWQGSVSRRQADEIGLGRCSASRVCGADHCRPWPTDDPTRWRAHAAQGRCSALHLPVAAM